MANAALSQLGVGGGREGGRGGGNSGNDNAKEFD